MAVSVPLISHHRDPHGRAKDQHYSIISDAACTPYGVLHRAYFFLEPAQWTRLAADVSELYVEVRAQTPADVGKGKMNRGSIDKICVAHLIIPRLCRE